MGAPEQWWLEALLAGGLDIEFGPTASGDEITRLLPRRLSQSPLTSSAPQQVPQRDRVILQSAQQAG
ncbi:hypothetical protein E4K10_28295 [Streptomyces sp. T1317-0309]|nr:hypothetical protein E4K10_28295 [Streptomyces sp. T1317-0309]